MKTKASSRSSKASNTEKEKLVHISSTVHKKLKMFCASLDIEIGRTAEKAITDYITRNS